MAVFGRRARGRPRVGVRAFAGKRSTRRSLDLAIVKLNEIADGVWVVALIANSIRRFVSVVEWTFGDGIVARAHGDYREAESDRQLAIRVQMSP